MSRVALGAAMLLASARAAPVPLIIDTDLGFDVDDAGAIAVGNALQDQGHCDILGIVHNTAFYLGIGGVDVIDHFYNRSHLELGAYTGAWGSGGDAYNAQNRYTQTIQHNYPSPVQNYDQVYSAVDAYTKMLTNADDNSVVIASIGELTNLRDILKANKDLFVQKVAAIYYMDGGYNFGCADSNGSGWSPWLGSTKDCDGAAQYVIDNIPKTIKQVFTVNGGNVLTGGRYTAGCGQGPVKEAYQIWTNDGSRPSWDPMTVYYAVMGETSLFSSVNEGTNSVDYYGREHFDTSQKGNNQFQTWMDGSKAGEVTYILDNLMCAAPCRAEVNVGGCASYALHSITNCYPGHGATDLENPQGSSAGVMTLAACQKLCDNTANCQGVTVAASGNSGLVNCYRKGDINIGACDSGQYNYQWDTWTKR